MSRPTRRPAVELPFLGRRDPETGRALCVWCGTAVQGRRVRWCSDTCVRNYRIAKGDQTACRRFVWQKDRGVCQLCKVDVPKRKRRIVEEHGYVPKEKRKFVKWEADHIVPLIENGTHSPDNLRTLCVPCHRDVTKALRKRLAARKTSGS